MLVLLEVGKWYKVLLFSNGVYPNAMFHAGSQWQGQNIDHMNSQKTSHISLFQTSYMVSIISAFKEINCAIIYTVLLNMMSWSDAETITRDYSGYGLSQWELMLQSNTSYFKLILWTDIWSISYEIAVRWVPQDLTDDESTLAQVMTWCHQATSHYLNQCWPRSMSPYATTRPQWANIPLPHFLQSW